MGTLADRQRAAAFDMLGHIMQELLQLIDLDFYRWARLLIVRAELEHLRQRRSASAETEQNPLGGDVQLGSEQRSLLPTGRHTRGSDG